MQLLAQLRPGELQDLNLALMPTTFSARSGGGPGHRRGTGDTGRIRNLTGYSGLETGVANKILWRCAAVVTSAHREV